MCLLQLYKEVQAKDRSALLNVIVNYLEIALENPLDDSTRATLSLSHSASKPLVYVIDGLLYLTGTTKEPTPRSFRYPGRASRIIPNTKAARYSEVHRFRVR